MQLWQVWLSTGVVLLVVEMLTPGMFFFACFGLGAFIAAAAAHYGVHPTAVWLIFVSSSLILVALARSLSAKFLQGKGRPSNVDEYIGKEGLVTQAIAPHHPGVVRVGGESWRACAEAPIAVDQTVVIERIEGTSAFVKPVSN